MPTLGEIGTGVGGFAQRSRNAMSPWDMFPQDPAAAGRLMDYARALPQPQQGPSFLDKLGTTTLGKMAQDAWSAVKAPGDAYAGRLQVIDPTTGRVSDEAIKRGFDLGGLVMSGGFGGGVPKGAIGSTFSDPLMHGSPRTGLTELNPSVRGPLGPGVYTTPAPNVAGLYAGEGTTYTLPQKNRDIYNGLGQRYGDYAGHEADKARLIAAAEPQNREAVASLVERMGGEGYPLYARLRGDIYKGDEGAQNLFKRAGFEGLSGHVDGPEVLLFGKQELASPTVNTLADLGKPGITAYHGSPHSFDRFDMSKIGTGEGAQAYGHGLYFAENEAIAKSYREGLSKIAGKTKAPLIEGMEAPKFSNTAAVRGLDDESEAARLYWNFVKSQSPGSGKSYDALNFGKIKNTELFDAFVDNVKSQKAQSPGSEDYYNTILKGAEKIKPKLNEQPIAGSMYEVRINADPEHFLDWDKPLAQQSETVRRQLGWTPEAENAYNAAQKNDTDALLAALEGNPNSYKETKMPVPTGLPPLSATGADIVKGGSIFDRASDVAKAQALREKGIPGIKYLDAGSRTAGDGSRNYVVFDDKLVEILRKYGWVPGAAIPTAAMYEYQKAQQQPQQAAGPQM